MLSPKQQEKFVADCQVALDMFTLWGVLDQAANELGMQSSTFKNRIKGAQRLGLVPSKGIKPFTGGREHLFNIREEKLPAKGKVKRFLLTSAQNNTRVNATVWQGLLTFAKHVGAEIYVSRYMYNTSAYGQPANAKPGTSGTGAKSKADLWYDPEVEPYLCDERVILAPGLAWCGEVNIRPTAEDPLSGFEAYTGRNSGIFPHAKIAMRSIASGKNEATKFNYTTGTVTLRHYIQRKEGLKAEFHHAYGALLAEVDSNGDWWCRQVNADKTGTFYDLDVRVQGKKLTTGHRLESITWGDVHVAQIDTGVKELAWGKGGVLDTLRPKMQFFHDVLDMHARNHHDAKDPHKNFAKHVRGEESVGNEVADVAEFFRFSQRPWAKSIAVSSNHHDHLLRWLKEADWRKDPVNAEFFIDAQGAVLKAIRRDDKSFDILKWAVDRAGGVKGLQFLAEDESYITCKRAGDGIENGMHGHLGPNGARPSPKSFTKMGRKANVAHSHTCGIYDGVYIAGTSSRYDLGYNRGPSSWSQSEIATYQNGKRAILTLWNGKARA